MALLFNAIYALIVNPDFQAFVNFLNILTMYTICLSLALLLLAIVLLDGTIHISNINQLIFFIGYSLFCSILFFIPDSVQVKITSKGTQLSPQWSLSFSIIIILIVLAVLISAWFYTISLMRKFRNPVFKKKLLFFILGISIFSYLPIMVAITNYYNILVLRIFFVITSIISIPAGILVYYGLIITPKVPYLNRESNTSES